MQKVIAELLRTIDNGDLAGAERCLRKGADANYRYSIGNNRDIPLLFRAALRGDLKMVDLLVSVGADPLAVEPRFGRNAIGFLLLHYRQGEEFTAIVRFLLAQGLRADDPPHTDYISPWWDALHKGYPEYVKVMLESGIDPNAPLDARLNFTPLMQAARVRSAASVILLLQAGADPNVRDSEGLTAAELVEKPDPYDFGDDWSPEATGEVLRLLSEAQASRQNE